MTFNTIERTTLKRRITGNKTLRTALVLVWSCDPLYTIALFTDIFKANMENANILVFFQRWNYPTEEMSTCGDKRKCRIAYQQKAYLEKKQHKYSDNFSFFKCKGSRPTTFQVHTKSIVLVLSNGDVEFLQFSWNLNSNTDNAKSLVYKGFPKDLDLLTKVVQKQQDFLSRFVPLFDSATSPEPICKDVHRAVLSFKTNKRENIDSHTTIVVSVPTCIHVENSEYGSLRTRIKQILTKTTLERKPYYYNKYLTDASDSVLVALYSFVDVRLLDKVCDVVGEVFVSPTKVSNQTPETSAITTAYPETFNDNERRVHEKFVYRLAHLDTQRIVWLFFCSHNLTLPSWQAESTGSEEGEWNVSQETQKNLDVGLLTFSEPGYSPYQTIHSYLLKYYYMDNDTFTKFHQSTCRRLGAVGNNKKRPTTMKQTQPNEEPAPSGDSQCASRLADAWERFRERTVCLVEHLLPKAVGMDQLLNLPEFQTDNYTRFALYDYVFNHLTSSLQWVRTGSYSRDTLRDYFENTSTNEVWFTSAKKYLIIETIIDVYLAWGRCFELFDSSILRTRPAISHLTLVDYGHIVWSNVDNYFLVDPKLLRQRVDRGNKVSPYDTLSFLVQHMFEEYEVWWQCPTVKDHQFYWDVKSMFKRPECAVCKTSTEVRLVYETIAQLNITKFLTVEFPIFKRESGYQQDKLIDDYVTRGYPDIQGIQLEPKESLLCYGTPHDTQRLMNMRYDIFYVVGNKAVAIELDDPSHRVYKERGKENEAEFKEPVRKRHNTDAVKNVLSWLMNIHLVRIATVSNDALTVIPSVVLQVTKWVSDSRVHLHNNLASLYQHVQNIKNTTPETTEYKDHEFETIHARDLQNPTTTANNISFNTSKPVSCVINTNAESVQLSRDTLHLYLSRGKLHVVNQERTPGVPICLYTDLFSLFYNFSSLKLFQTSRQPNRSETWFKINKNTRVGTFYDSTEHGGTHVVVNHPVDESEPILSFNLTKVPKWERSCETTPNLNATDSWYHKLHGTHLADPVQFVRLFETFHPRTPTQQEKELFESRARGSVVDPLYLEGWMKVRKDIFVSKEDNLSDRKRVRITSIVYDNKGVPTIRFKDVYNPVEGYFTRNTVLAAEIVDRVRGPRGERSRYVPLP